VDHCQASFANSGQAGVRLESPTADIRDRDLESPSERPSRLSGRPAHSFEATKETTTQPNTDTTEQHKRTILPDTAATATIGNRQVLTLASPAAEQGERTADASDGPDGRRTAARSAGGARCILEAPRVLEGPGVRPLGSHPQTGCFPPTNALIHYCYGHS
jgi:hypothetical protein